MHKLAWTIVMLSLSSCAFAAPNSAKIAIDVNKPGHAVPASLWGIFFEEINHAGDGGIYPELVRNRSFEDAETPERWTAVGGATLELVGRDPATTYNRRALKVTCPAGGDGVANEGYWGMATADGGSYRLSITARGADGYKGGINVAIVSPTGRVLASGKTAEVGSTWQDLTLTLKSSGAEPKGKLQLTTSAPGAVVLDYVSLLPARTWKGRENGLRPDLAEALDALKPAFVRFPGGCWVEGDTMAQASRWKTTIGPVRDRRTQWNLWQYWSTNGLGYHEYLQMSEDLGAEALFVVNCGMSHRENVPMDQMGEYVQDALDAIEYANGPASSKWGAVRAAAGHPRPFNLKYLEIGNENGGPAYNERYALIYDAVSKQYPDIQIIANVWGGAPGNRPTPILDEHYYSNPTFFINNANRYDTYDRNGPKIYVGEYAVTQGNGEGSLRGALGEAAFMTGMERNSDVVTMSSYAPLFANLNFKRWNPDLIYFDSSRVALPPSYHVQRLFSNNRPDVVLPITLTTSGDVAKGNPNGAIGLATWGTQSEFDDIKVTAPDGRVLFSDDFSGGSGKWKAVGGRWVAEGGVLKQTGSGENLRITAGDAAWKDYTVTLRARRTGGDEGFIVMFRVADSENYLWANYGGWGNSRHRLERAMSGSKEAIGKDSPGTLENNRWYDVKVEVAGERAKMYLDGKLIDEVTFPPVVVKPLHAVVGRQEKSGEVILKVVNVAGEDCATEIALDGAATVSATGSVTTLTGDPAGENSLDTPNRIAPVTRPLRGAGKSFTYTFPANSLTVIRLKASS